MGMIQKNSEWEHKTSVKKGNIGERIVRQYLESKGLVVYQPVTERAHAFDMLAIKDKKQVVIAEIKSKALMNKWKATGFEQRHYQEYINIQKRHGIPVFVFFVDEHMGKIYGNTLDELDKEMIREGAKFPLLISNGTTRIYHFDSMKIVHDLTAAECEELKQYTRRSYKYAR